MRQKDFFTKRLAALFLAQARSQPVIKSRVPGFKSVGEILASEEYWAKKARDWSDHDRKPK